MTPTPEVRKTVTIVFCDVVGSTSLAEGLDAESWGEIMVRYFDRMSAALKHHGGSIEKFIGDAVMAVFGLPTAHEDDALRAVRAAADMRSSLAELNETLDREFGIRIMSRTGIHTGEIVASGAVDQPMPLGDAANTAARFEQAAAPGEILIGASTYRLVKDAVRADLVEPLTLKGKAEPIAAYRLVEVVPHAPGVARRMDAPMVGRQEELHTLLRTLQTTETERRCSLVTVVGEAGVGKTRLLSAFQEHISSGAELLQGRCLPYGEAITFWPIAEALRGAAEIHDEDPSEVARAKLGALASGDPEHDAVAQVVAAAIGLGGGGVSLEETSWAISRLLVHMARRSSLVLVLDDLQWAADSLLDLVERLAAEVTGVRLLLVCMARPELLEQRPAWTGSLVRLEGLGSQECLALMTNALGGSPLEPALGLQLAEATGGNPLFLDELVAMLIEDGSLERADGGWTLTRDLSALDVPPTIEALLAARLDRLPGAERTVLESASVIGQVFYPSAAGHLVAQEVRTAFPAAVDSLISRNLLRMTHEEFAGEPACRFRHLLIRDAAYRRLPKGKRANLHERFAEWLEGKVPERIAEFEEIIGYHLEQAYRYRTDLRPATEADRSLASRASQHLGSAGRRAMARGDGSAAVSLFERAIALLDARDATAVGLLLDLAVANGSTGQLERAASLLEEAHMQADAQGLVAVRARIELEDLRLRMQTEPSGIPAQVLEQVPRLIAVMEREGDDGGLANAWSLMADVHLITLSTEAATETLERALAHAETAGDLRQVAEIRKWLVLIDLWSPRPVSESLRRIDEVIGSPGSNPLVYATALTAKGWFVAALGQFDAGRALWRQGYDLLEELHQTLWRAATVHQGGRIELFAGDPVAAERIFRQGYGALEQMGERGYLSTVAGLLGLAVFDQGRLDEAEELAGVSKQACDESDIESQMLWRQGQARVLAARSQLVEAEHLAREAVRIGETTDDLTSLGEAYLDLAEVLRIADRPDGAASTLQTAIDLFAKKGVLVLQDRARASLAELVV